MDVDVEITAGVGPARKGEGWVGSVAELAFDAGDAWSVGRSVGDDIMRGDISLDRSRFDACCKGWSRGGEVLLLQRDSWEMMMEG